MNKIEKRLIYETRKLIKDEALFTSAKYKNLLQNIANGVCLMFSKRYSVKIDKTTVNIFWGNKSDNTSDKIAFTTGNSIFINANSQLANNLDSREEKYSLMKGLLVHELLHVFFTNFELAKNSAEYFSKRILFPSPNNITDDFNEYLKTSKNLNSFYSICCFIDNAIEDGFIEFTGSNEIPGYKKDLAFVRQLHQKSFPSFKTMIKNEKHMLFTISNLILQYAKFGEINIQKKDYKDERIEIFIKLVPYIDYALASYNSYERKKWVNSIIVELLPLITDYLSSLEPENEDTTEKTSSSCVLEEDKKTSGSSSKEEHSSETEKELEKYGSFAPVPSRASSILPGISAPLSESSTKPNISTASYDETSAEHSEEEIVNDVSASGATISDIDIPGDIEDALSRRKHLTSDTTYEDKEDSGYSKPSSDIERILNNMAEEQANTIMNEKLTDELNTSLKNISFDEIHSGLHVVVNRMSNVSPRLKDEYQRVELEIHKTSKLLLKNVMECLNTEESINRGFYFGNYLDTQAIAGNEKKIFMKKVKGQETPQIAVALRVDESGSMSISDRISYARLASLIIHDFCLKAGFPICIYGDTADTCNKDVILNCYADFNRPSKEDQYRIMDMSARSNNRDGYAIRFVGEQLLKKVSATHKILIVISDGLPAANGYFSSIGCSDVTNTVRYLRKNGIIVFSAAIGDDKENIKKMYNEGFLDISNLKLLPKTLVSLIKKYIH